MKKLLYIGHSFHNKTKSSQFIQELLAEKYEIEKFDFNPYIYKSTIFEQLKGKAFDDVVLWQVMPSIFDLKKYISFKNIAFFPMYDGVADFNSPIWSEYRDCNIINFSHTLNKKCKEYGLSSYYIQYFPKPKNILNQGDKNKVFLWQREENISIETIDKTIGINNLDKVYLHRVPDPECNLKDIPEKWQDKVQISEWFDSKSDMDNYMQDCAIYYAPRKLEGIGMSFLEAMALGRCVIAPDNPTMNEYISNGQNGYLYDYKNPVHIDLENIDEIQKNAYEFIAKGYEKFEANKREILKWIEIPVEINSDKNLMDSKLIIKKPKYISINFAKIVNTKKYTTIKLFNFIPLKIKRKG